MATLFTIMSALALSSGFTSGSIDLEAKRVFDLDREARFRIAGPVDRQVRGVVKNWLLGAPDRNPAMLRMFRDRDRQPYQNLLPWSGEFAGKYLTAGTQVYRLTRDRALKELLGRFVGELIACQGEDGYLGPFPLGHRLNGFAPNVWGGGGDTWDAWGHYHVMLGLLLWNEEVGDAKALECAKRIGDLLCDTFRDRSSTTAGSPEMNQGMVHSLAMLYEKTAEPKYLDLAKKVVAEFSDKGAGDYLNAALDGKDFYQLPNKGPRWESLHSIMGLAELYWITGSPGYRKAFESLWWSIARTDRHNNGGFSSGEQAQGNPYDQGVIETCCTIAWIAMGVEMLRMTGDPRVADELELSTLNQVVALHASDGKWCTYNTPMDGVRYPSMDDIAFQQRPGSEELNCCSVNGARGFGMIADWALMRQDDGLVLNWYGPGSTKTKAGAVPVTLRQTTDYPRSGKVEIEVDPSKPIKFALNLRIPHWSARTKAFVNGKAVVCKPGTYLKLDRLWKPGDRVILDLDTTPRFWVGERECEGKASVYRGPILYALWKPARLPAYSAEWEQGLRIRTTKSPGAWVEHRFKGGSVRWHAVRFDDAGQARVSIDGKEIEMVDLYSPLRDVPFVWERKGLGDGTHTLRIEAVGTRNPASKNAWINVVAIEPIEPTPSFTPDAFQSVRFIPSKNGVGTLEVSTASGRKVRLCDFGTAGLDRTPYVSWLPMAGQKPAPFTLTNPSRTVRPKPSGK